MSRKSSPRRRTLTGVSELLTLRIDKTALSWLKEKARRERISASALVRRIIMESIGGELEAQFKAAEDSRTRDDASGAKTLALLEEVREKRSALDRELFG